MNSWIDDSSVSGVLIFVILVYLVVVAAMEVAVISTNKYLVMETRRIFVLLARAAAADASYYSSLGSYDYQLFLCLQVISNQQRHQ